MKYFFFIFSLFLKKPKYVLFEFHFSFQKNKSSLFLKYYWYIQNCPKFFLWLKKIQSTWKIPALCLTSYVNFKYFLNYANKLYIFWQIFCTWFILPLICKNWLKRLTLNYWSKKSWKAKRLDIYCSCLPIKYHKFCP